MPEQAKFLRSNSHTHKEAPSPISSQLHPTALGGKFQELVPAAGEWEEVRKLQPATPDSRMGHS